MQFTCAEDCFQNRHGSLNDTDVTITMSITSWSAQLPSMLLPIERISVI